MYRVATRRALLYPKVEAVAAEPTTGPITWTTTKSGAFDINITKTGDTPDWYPGDGSGPISTVDLSHSYADASSKDGFCYFDDPLTLTVLTYGFGLLVSDFSISSECTNLTTLQLPQSTFTSLDLSAFTLLDEFWVHFSGSLTSLDLSANTNLTYLLAYSCSGLTSLDLSANTLLNNIRCDACGFSESVVDTILSDVEAYGTSGSYNLRMDGSNAAPSAAGLADKATLEGRGWTVTVST